MGLNEIESGNALTVGVESSYDRTSFKKNEYEAELESEWTRKGAINHPKCLLS